MLSPNFLSALGGAMSLMLGISFIMIAEVVELLWDFLMNCLNYSLGRGLGRQHHLL